MIMSREEIIKEWKMAKSKTKQVHILADMNCCKVADIKKILIEEGLIEAPKSAKKPIITSTKATSKPLKAKIAPKVAQEPIITSSETDFEEVEEIEEIPEIVYPDETLDIPPTVIRVCLDEMDRIAAKMKALNREYEELAKFIKQEV